MWPENYDGQLLLAIHLYIKKSFQISDKMAKDFQNAEIKYNKTFTLIQ